MLYLNSKDLNNFLKNLYVLAEEIMEVDIAEGVNLFTISDNKIPVGK